VLACCIRLPFLQTPLSLIGFCRAKQVILLRGIQTEFYCDAEIQVDYGNAVHRSLVKAIAINAALWGTTVPGTPTGQALFRFLRRIVFCT
jgi:hypothetical protein